MSTNHEIRNIFEIMEDFVAAASNKSSASRPCSIQGNLSTASNLSESSELCYRSETNRKRRFDAIDKEKNGLSPQLKKRALKDNSMIDDALIPNHGENHQADLNGDAGINVNAGNSERYLSVSDSIPDIASPVLSQEMHVTEKEEKKEDEMITADKRDHKNPLKNKSFFSSERLSELLQDLPDNQFEMAKRSCEILRFPPSLAAEIQSLKSQLRNEDDYGVVEQSRCILKHGLVIHPEHFGPDLKKWLDEGRALLHGSSNPGVTVAVDDCVSESNDGEFEGINSSNDAESVQSDQAGNEFEPTELAGTVDGNQQESAGDLNVEQSEFVHKSFDVMVDEGISPQTNYEDQSTNREQSMEIILDESDDDCVITGESIWASNTTQRIIDLAQQRLERSSVWRMGEPGMMASRRRRAKDDDEASRLGSIQSRPYPRSRYNSSSSLPSTSLVMRQRFTKAALNESEFNYRCSLGRDFVVEVKNNLRLFGISPDTASSLSVLALSADFLVPSQCIFGRPHLVQACLPGSSSREELCFLVGDVLRIKLLKVGDLLNGEYRELFEKMLGDCHTKIHFVEYQDVRVRTEMGFQRISEDWPEVVFSLPPNFIVKPLLPLVPVPSLSLYYEITRLLTGPHFYQVTSWINVVDANVFANAVISSVSVISIPLSVITVDPWNVQLGDFFSHAKAQFLQEFLGTKATERASLILSRPQAKEPLTLLIALLDPVMKKFAVSCGSTYTLHFASLGFVCYLFYRLFVHFYIGRGNSTDAEVAELRSKFRLIEETADMDLYKYDVFTQLQQIHYEAVNCLKILTENAPKMLMAGACLQATYLLNHEPNKYTPEDEKRRRLYSSADEARQEILDVFKKQIRSALVVLLEAVNDTNDFFTMMVEKSLKMFYQPFSRGGESQVAHQLLGLGFETINELDSEQGFGKFKQVGEKRVTYNDAKLAIKHLTFKRKSLQLRPTNLFHIIPKMARQMTFFRKALLNTRICLNDSWWAAFRNKSADVKAKDSIVVLKKTLKKLFGIIESWTRLVYEIVRGTGEEMLNNVKLEHGMYVEFLYNRDFKALPTLEPPPKECKLEEEGIDSFVEVIMHQSALPSLPPLFGEGPSISAEPSPAASPRYIPSTSLVRTLTPPTIVTSRNPKCVPLRTSNPTPNSVRLPVSITTNTNKNLIIANPNTPQLPGTNRIVKPPFKNFIIIKDNSQNRSFCPSILKTRRQPQPLVRVHNTVRSLAAPVRQIVPSMTVTVNTATGNVASSVAATIPCISSRDGDNSVGKRNIGGDLLVTKLEPPDNASQQRSAVVVAGVPQPPGSLDSVRVTEESHPASSSNSMDRREQGRRNRKSKILFHRPSTTTTASTSDSVPNNGVV